MTGTRSRSDELSGSLGNAIETITDSVLLKLAVAGVGLVVFAALLQVFVVDPDTPGLAGVWAALFPVWGVGLVLVGVGGYLFVRWRQRGDAG